MGQSARGEIADSFVEFGSDHSQVEIDNDGVERDVRPVDIGRKNSLFVGSSEAGDRSAVLYKPAH